MSIETKTQMTYDDFVNTFKCPDAEEIDDPYVDGHHICHAGECCVEYAECAECQGVEFVDEEVDD